MGNPITEIIHSEMEQSTCKIKGNNNKTGCGCEHNNNNTCVSSINNSLFLKTKETNHSLIPFNCKDRYKCI